MSGIFDRFSCLLLLVALAVSCGLPTLHAQQFAASSSEKISSTSTATANKTSQIKLERMLLLLKPTDKQQSALDALLNAQQTRGNAQFHQWVAPAEFADRFAPSSADTNKVATWLRTQGFTVAALPQSRGWIEFSGTAAQVTAAFGTSVAPLQQSIQSASFSGMRYQLSGKASFPASISATIRGLVSLDGTEAVSASTAYHVLDTNVKALAAAKSIETASVLTPALAATLLHLPGASNETSSNTSETSSSETGSSETGAGQSIAILSRSSVRPEDFAAFRKSFGLPESQLEIQPGATKSTPAPGRNEEEAAAMAAASWAGVAAPGAHIMLVPAATTNATDGVDLALAAAVDQSLAGTISIGFSSCESGMNAAHQAFYASVYRQAAAEGIAIIAATGDSGAAACHAASDTSSIQTGLAVNALASTPWNTSIGAVAVSAVSSDSEKAEPSGSIPGSRTVSLNAWQTAAASQSLYATGGGSSTLYPLPAWQSAQGLPAAGTAPSNTQPSQQSASQHRSLPDISLPTVVAAGEMGSKAGSAFCLSAETSNETCRLVSSGGSAVSAAVFSGIAAVLAGKYGPQGNLAPNLYTLEHSDLSLAASNAQSKAAANFSDVTAGSAKLPCESGSANCSQSGEIGFDASAGYDLASGLGSINAQALIHNWATPLDTGTASDTVEMVNVGGMTYNPSASITLTAKVISGSGSTVPTGTIQFYDETVSSNTGTPVTLATDGTASYTEKGQFTNGGHNIAAIYSGDTTYQPNESQPVTINIQPSATSMTVMPSTTTPAGGSIVTVTGIVTATNPGATAPTGLITVNLDGITQGTGTLSTTGTTTSASVSVTVPASGAHTIQGTYAGDTNYNNSTSPAVTVTISKVATVTTIAATPSAITTGTPETFTATLAPATPVTGTTYTLTGTVSFYDGTTLLGTAVVSSNTAILTGITLSSTASHTVTAVYSGDTTYSTSTSAPLLLSATLAPVTVTLTSSVAILSPGQAVTLTAVVTPVNSPPATAEQHPSGYVLFYAGTALVGTQSPVVQSTGYSSVASTFVSSLPAGQYVITAVYSGDPTYGPATSNSLNLSVEDFTISCSSTSITMVQGTTQTVPCTVASLGGLTGAIQVVCEEQNPPTLGAIACSFNPTLVTGSGPTSLTVVTTAGNVSQADARGNSDQDQSHPMQPSHRSPPWPAAGGGAALALAGLLLSPIGRRARCLRQRHGKLLALTLLLAGMASAGLGCSNTVTAVNQTGTPLGLHTLKLTAAADVNTVTVSHYAYLTVNVTP